MRIHDLNRGCGVVPSTVTAVLWRNLVSSLVQPEWTMAQRAISHIQDPATEDHNKKTEYSNLSVLGSINHNQGFLLPQLFWGCSPALTHSLQAPLLMPPLNHSRRHPGNACGRKALKNHATSHAAWCFSSGMNLASSPAKISEYLSYPVIILSVSLLTSCWRHYFIAIYVSYNRGPRFKEN